MCRSSVRSRRSGTRCRAIVSDDYTKPGWCRLSTPSRRDQAAARRKTAGRRTDGVPKGRRSRFVRAVASGTERNPRLVARSTVLCRANDGVESIPRAALIEIQLLQEPVDGRSGSAKDYT
jgi:hypothetical protein